MQRRKISNRRQAAKWEYGITAQRGGHAESKLPEMKTGVSSKKAVFFRAQGDGAVTVKRGQKGQGAGN